MKSAFSLAACLLLMCSCSEGENSTASNTSSQSTSNTSTSTQDMASHAEELVREVVEAYRTVPAFTDTMRMEVLDSPGSQPQEMFVSFEGNGYALIKVGGLTITALDGWMYVVRDDVKDKYFVTEFDGGIVRTLNKIMGRDDAAPPSMSISDRPDMQGWLRAMTFDLLPNPRIYGLQDVEGEDGVTYHEITLLDEMGSAWVRIHPETKFMHSVRAEYTPPWEKIGVTATVVITMDPKAVDTASIDILFDPQERILVSSLTGLRPTTRTPGEEVHDFSLPNLDGEYVTLSDLRGSIIVIEFWAMWSISCIPALQSTEVLAEWAESTGQPIEVFAVHVWGEFDDEQSGTDEIRAYWQEQGLSIPTLIDFDNVTVSNFGVKAVPGTLVIGPDGKVLRQQHGFSTEVFEEVKSMISDALGLTGVASE